MKRLYFLLVTLCFTVTLFAQSDKSIVIDQTTFRTVHSDALTGVNIDPIGLDSSRHPCARIKMKVERMTREEIDGLEVKLISNNQLTRCATADYENGLILEMTAKTNTRFYLHHNDFGDSNEINLNLEGNKEYYIEARLNQQYSITVGSNVAGANVYLDQQFKGRTDGGFILIVKDVFPGNHTLMVEYGGIKYEQPITVNANSIFFRQMVNTQASKPQYVVFEVVPQNAMVVIDNKYYAPQDGVVSLVLENGSYNYTVSAADYHPQSSVFTVSGAKVEKRVVLSAAFGWLEVGGGDIDGAKVFVDDKLIGTAPLRSDKLGSGEHSVRIIKELYKSHTGTVVIRDNQVTTYAPKLSADYATVTLNAPGAEIWINGVKKGTNTYSGRLATGTYLFESHKNGYKNGSVSQTILATPAVQSYNLPMPVAMVGMLDIQSTPAMANINIDGKSVGRTPIMLDNILVGTHKVTISKTNYAEHTQTVTIVEGKTTNINVVLNRQSSQSVPQVAQPSAIAYNVRCKVGDYYDDGTMRGVVFQVSADGRSGKIVSLTKAGSMVTWSTGIEAKRNIGATNTTDGEANFELVKRISDWQSKYPAFSWCASLGEGWYLPAKEELIAIQQNKHLIEPKLTDKLADNFYFSSTESYTEEGGMKCVYDVGMKSGGYLTTRKGYHSYVLAVAKVGIAAANSNASTPQYSSNSLKVYSIGDLYDVNGKRGVVFEVDASGQHGKIISINCSQDLAWALGSEQRRFIGATDKYDGQKNMDVVRSISGWQSKYPVFNWCANLGSGWYLPANEEWKKIYSLRHILEPKLSRKLDIFFWTSTEEQEIYKNLYCAWNIYTGSLSSYCKNRTNAVFAVSKF